MGLSSSLHCIGMCGPIAMILPIQNANPAEKIIKTFVYHLGRILVYAILGATFGLLGMSFQLMGVLQVISIIFGVLIIVGVLFPRIFAKVEFFNRLHMKLNAFVHKSFGQFIKRRGVFSLFILGMLNGLLPCGAVYFALLGSLVYGGIFEGALFMTVFGLGTLPAMAIITYFASSVSLSLRSKFRKIAPVIMLVFGVLFVARGMNLGIPLVSPKVEYQKNGDAEMSCCSKKGTDACKSKTQKKRKTE